MGKPVDACAETEIKHALWIVGDLIENHLLTRTDIPDAVMGLIKNGFGALGSAFSLMETLQEDSEDSNELDTALNELEQGVSDLVRDGDSDLLLRAALDVINIFRDDVEEESVQHLDS